MVKIPTHQIIWINFLQLYSSVYLFLAIKYAAFHSFYKPSCIERCDIECLSCCVWQCMHVCVRWELIQIGWEIPALTYRTAFTFCILVCSCCCVTALNWLKAQLSCLCTITFITLWSQAFSRISLKKNNIFREQIDLSIFIKQET